MQVEVWSDVVCPWCYLGKRRMERAVRRFEYGDRVTIVWRSFQLNPWAPADGGRTVDMLSDQLGIERGDVEAMNANLTAMAAEEGLDYHLDTAPVTNTRDAHRLLHLARESGLEAALEEALFHAYCVENRILADHAVLRDVATRVGLEPDAVDRVLGSEAYAPEVEAEQEEAEQLGAQGVPFYVVDRVYGIAGAQSVDVMLETLRRAWRHTRALPMASAAPPPDPDGAPQG